MKIRGTATDKLSDVIQSLQLIRKSGLLTAERDGPGNSSELGTITFRDGQVIDASVGNLRGAQVVANEQSWMVEASQVALQSIKYYTNAARVASQHLSALSGELTHKTGSLDERQFRQSLQDIAEAARYIDLAVGHQESANEKLAAALRVTTRATEQLTNGAESTDGAATELERIVQQLTAVVGANDTDAPPDK